MAKIVTPTAAVTQQDGRIRIDIEDVNGKTSAVIPNEPMAREVAEEAARQAQQAAEEATNQAQQAGRYRADIESCVTAATWAKTEAIAAASSASEAANSASEAKTSETNAKTSETNAKTSETNAKTSETNAKTSETNAKTSETNAKTSETNAASSKTAAANSAAAAKTSETNAASSAKTAESWAVGGTGSRSGEDTDNAKYWAKQTETIAGKMESIISGVSSINGVGGSVVISLDESTGDVEIKGGNNIYGFHIDGTEADPSAAVTYLGSTLGMTPAKMDYTNGVFDYGSWENAFFMPRPCMLKQNGTVAYYLDPNDLTKKEDGTDSDIANTAFEGNAMMEWGKNGRKIWLKVVPCGTDNTSADVFIADYQADSSYHAWSFMDANGAYIDHFYTPIYNGSLVDGVMRSISGQAVLQKLTANDEITYAQANGTGWMIENFGDRLLINYLLILMGKSLDTQTVFGNGIISGGETAFNNYVTGALNDKGLFYGSSGTTTAVKVFGMENYWGLQWRRTTGVVIQNGTIKYKLTESNADGADGGYTITGENYIDTGVFPVGTSGNYTNVMTYAKDGAMLPAGVSGSSSTYYCDGCWYDTKPNTYARFGGNSGSSFKCGIFYMAIDINILFTSWSCGAAVFYKPLT